MKKTLMTLSLISAIAIGTQASYAFDWGYLNPANWTTCKKCEKVKPNCKCKKQSNKSLTHNILQLIRILNIKIFIIVKLN